MDSIWRVPWTEVRYGTEHEQSDIEFNTDWANDLLSGNLDLWKRIIANAPDHEGDRHAQGSAVTDDVAIALDMLGWKVVSQDDPKRRWPICRDDDFRPAWAWCP
jgi:hypothetical protein